MGPIMGPDVEISVNPIWSSSSIFSQGACHRLGHQQSDEARSGDPRDEYGRCPAPQPCGCIHHTDRGTQYCGHNYQKILRRYKFRVSMSGKGNC